MGRHSKLPPFSIKWKIFLYLIGFCVLLLVILWLFQTVFLDSFYKAIKLSEIEEVARTLSAYAEQEDWDALENAVRDRGDLYIEIFDRQGNTYTVPDNYPEGIPFFPSPQQKQELYEQTLQNNGTLVIRDTETDPPKPNSMLDYFSNTPPMMRHREGLLYARIFPVSDTENALLLVSTNLTPINATVQTLRIQLFYISAIMIILAIGLAILISKRVSRPIERLNQAAGELGKGHYDVHFSGRGYREVAELAGTLNHAARELGKTEALQRELIANVSHDLRTPLTLITGYAEMMRDLPGEDTPENMQVIIEESKRLSSLVGDLLDLSRLQSGTVEMCVGRFDLTDEIRAVITRFSKFSEPEGYQISFDYAEDVFVEADSTRVAQVIYNFLINAMTHGGSDKRIEVRQLYKDRRVRIEVADHGKGIAPENLDNIWDRYYKLDEVHQRSATGTGLGLSIVKNILDAHPGIEYGVNSQVGKGSVFWFSLAGSVDNKEKSCDL